MSAKIVVVGCGIVGAFIAYELSRQTSDNIVVIDSGEPAQGATGAALGVLMGVISGKVKGRTWRLREASIRRYQRLIEELSQSGYSVPFNSQGIVSLCYDDAKLPRWKTLQTKRAAQGWPLEIWTPGQLQARCPQVSLINHTNADDQKQVKAAIYSSADRQVHPVALTKALIAAACDRGVVFHNNTTVTQLTMDGPRCLGLQTTQGAFDADWVVLSAGLGAAALAELGPTELGPTELGPTELSPTELSQTELGPTTNLETTNLETTNLETTNLETTNLETTNLEAKVPLQLIPVLGQAMDIELPELTGHPDFQPVINGNDIQVVPLGKGRYWIGATVEFPPESGPLIPEAEGLANLKRGAEGFIPALSQATILNTWSGLRPRPVGQPAPVIKPLGNTQNVILATGHYRNGVLLAPATAQQLCELLVTP